MEQKKKFFPTPRIKWAMMPILDFYILREFLIPLSVLILGFTILFLIGNIFDDLKELLENKAKIKVMVEFFLLRLPGNIRFILPISVLLACMYVMANFGKNREIIAMRASGISMQRCCASIYAVALLVTGVNFWFNEEIVPISEKKAVVLRKSLGSDYYRYNILEKLTYRSPERNSTWFFKYFDVSGVQKDIILKKFRSDSSLEWNIEAAEAVFIPKEGWEFRDCVLTKYSEDGFLPGPPEKMKVIKKDLKEFPETPTDIMNAARPASELPSIVIFDILRKTKNMAKSCQNVYETTLYSRLAFPWTCVIAVFLGIPLAVRNERSGIFISIVIAVGIMVSYQMLSNIFCIFGCRGYLPPIVAGLGPTVAFIIYGVSNVRKHN